MNIRVEVVIMLIKTLLDILDSQNIVYEYTGPKTAQIYAVQMQNGAYRYKEGILYMKQIIQKPEPPRNMCVIAGGEELYDIIQDELLSYSKRETALLKLQYSIAEENSLAGTVTRIAGFMGNPCVLFRDDKKVLAWSGFPETGESELSMHPDSGRFRRWIDGVDLEKVCEENEDIIACCGQSGEQPYTFMAASFINSRGVRRYCVVIEQQNAFKPVADKIFLKNVCAFLDHSQTCRDVDYRPEDRIDAILKSMLLAVPGQKECIYEELLELGWKKKEKYYVLAVDFSRGKVRSEAEDMRVLSGSLGARVFVHENYYICLFGGTLQEEYDSTHLLGIEKWLEEQNYYAGLSYGLYDITEISFGYQQALLTISKSLPMLSNVHYYTFSEGIVTYLVTNCGSAGKLDFKHLCHPVIWRIYEYDQEYHTDYIDFLNTYIFSERSVKKTAEVLYMHRNTVYQKINKLKVIFNLDVDDHYIYIKIYVSLVALDQLRHSKDNSFIRWM